ncbi:DUF2804 domain-containing protein [Rheinheimera sp. WS51]|uniref:DUF2804 domain-containing protein n=1 Tax=Rheinheimera sp. WS51 TaxID=3425886 RepID=UPI003D8A4CB4
MAASTHINKLINDQGQPRFGYFDSPITDFALSEFAYQTVMDKPASRFAKYLHFKQFQFISISHPDWQIGIAIADIRYAANGFCYFYQRKENRLDEISIIKPLSFGVTMSKSPVAGCASLFAKQNIHICIDNNNWRLKLSGAMFNGEIQLNVANTGQPLAMCTPTGYNGWTYTQKHNALGLSGHLAYKGNTLDLSSALAGYDFSAGYMRRETSWRWASISAELTEGCFGLNLAAGVNETGFTENVFWLNGQKEHLTGVAIELNPTKPDAEWLIHSADKRIQLVFTPKKARQEKLNLGIVASNFRQYCGFFNGSIISEQGEKIVINQVPGLAENHFARW